MGNFLQEALRSLPQAALNPYAFVAYLGVIIAWVVIALRVKRNRELLQRIKDVPEEQRRDLLLAEMGSPIPPHLSAEQWLKSRRQLYFFYAFIAVCVAGVIVFVIAYLNKEPSKAGIRKVLEEFLPFAGYIFGLQEQAKERGVSEQQLKAEIDDWFRNVKAPYDKGLGALYGGRYQEAENYLNESNKSSKVDLVKSSLFLGITRLRQKKIKDAIDSLKTAVDLDTNNAVARFVLGTAYFNNEQFDEAIHSLETAIALDKNLPKVIYFVLGTAYFHNKNFDKAINSLEITIQTYRDLAKAYYFLGAAYRGNKEYNKAVWALKEAITHDENDVNAHNILGMTYTELGEYDLAVASYRKAINTGTASKYLYLADIYFNLACAYSRKNEKELAIESLKQSLTLNGSLSKDAQNDDCFSNISRSSEFKQIIRLYE